MSLNSWSSLPRTMPPMAVAHLLKVPEMLAPDRRAWSRDLRTGHSLAAALCLCFDIDLLRVTLDSDAVRRSRIHTGSSQATGTRPVSRGGTAAAPSLPRGSCPPKSWVRISKLHFDTHAFFFLSSHHLFLLRLQHVQRHPSDPRAREGVSV